MDCHNTLNDLISSWRKDRLNFYSKENQQKMIDFDTNCSTAKAQLIQDSIQYINDIKFSIKGINSFESILRKDQTNNSNEWIALVVDGVFSSITKEPKLSFLVVRKKDNNSDDTAIILRGLENLMDKLKNNIDSIQDFFKELDEWVAEYQES